MPTIAKHEPIPHTPIPTTTKYTKQINTLRSHPWVGGALILSTFLVLLFTPLSRSDILSAGIEAAARQRSDDDDTPSSSSFFFFAHLTTAVLCCSALNVTSHSAVVLFILDDAPVLSILVGVGFDVLSHTLYAIMWMMVLYLFTQQQPHNSNSNWNGLLFMAVISMAIGWNTREHIIALRMAKTHKRLYSVVQSAQNNLVGEPGPHGLDHVFAYCDLGLHLFHLIASVLCLGILEAGRTLVGLGVLFAVLHTMYSKVVTSSSSKVVIPQCSVDNDDDDDEVDIIKTAGRYLSISKEGRIICSCQSCSGRNAALCIDVRNRMLCELWFCSFRQLLLALDNVEQRESKCLSQSSGNKKDL